MLIFGLFWVGLIAFMGFVSLKSGIKINRVHTTDAVKIFSTLFTVAIPGLLVLTGWALQFFNHRKITVSRNSISYFDGPLWFGKTTQFNPSLITNLSIRSRVGGKVNHKPFYVLDINAHMKDNSIVKLCTARTLADALFIEQKIENYFNIKDNKTLDQVRVG